MKLSVVLLAYKEEENLRIIIPKVKSIVEKIHGSDYEVIVVDTPTTLDDTPSVCKEFNAIYVNQTEPGFGGAYRKGIATASGDALLYLDSDGSHNPDYIPAMYEKYMDGNDLVIGSRYTKGGTTVDAKSSQIMSHILNFIFRIVLGVKIKDVSTNFRIYRADVIKDLSLTSVNYDVLEEIILLMKNKLGKKNFRYEEVPIHFTKRMFGESKRRLLPFIISYIKTLFRLTFIRIRG
ncbi:MAG: glycosyltransferase [Saccharofermentans sp.]|nr:glycosyltransferase [Saccharofermentans sp.]